VRRLVGLERRIPFRGRRFGVRQHFSVEPWSDLVEVYWSDRVEMYVTPVAEDVVGVAQLGPPRIDFHESIAAIPELADRLRGAEPASSLRGAGPFRQRASSQVAGRVLLIGDASGYVDAITGEGLRLGFEQARLAIEAIREGRTSDYPARWRAATRDFRMLTTGLVAAAGGPLRRGIVPAARRLPGLYGDIIERLAR
jgi:flavin-dependent dehydrogenase